MHEISVSILQTLSISSSAQHKNLKPTQLSGNEFNYHLKRLLRDKFVNQQDEHYSLSPKGLRYVQQSNFASMQRREQSTQYSCTFITDNTNNYVTEKRLKIPFKDLYCPVMGKIHHGETLDDAVNRELTEKTGQTFPTKFSHISRIITRDQNGYLLTDITLYVHHTQKDNESGYVINSCDVPKENLFTTHYSIFKQTEAYKEYQYTI